MKYKFRNIKLSRPNLEKLGTINGIIEEYSQQGYTLTLRQLYYQLVSRDLIPNKQAEYAKISKLLKEGRMAGEVDWNAIEDRLRVPYIPYSNTSPNQAIEDAISQYRLNRQEGQQTYVEVWVEKDALSGVLRRITQKYHVRLLVNRGYGSVTAMHDAYKRIAVEINAGNRAKILYLGDHDPSGMDMIRDIQDRVLEMLYSLDGEEILIQKYGTNFHENEDFQEWNEGCQNDDDNYLDGNIRYVPEWSDEYFWHYDKMIIKELFSVDPIALTMEQIKEYTPPPNPAKITDPRAKDYIKKYGNVSWEVDALNPQTLNELLATKIEENIDMAEYAKILAQEIIDKDKLNEIDID